MGMVKYNMEGWEKLSGPARLLGYYCYDHRDEIGSVWISSGEDEVIVVCACADRVSVGTADLNDTWVCKNGVCKIIKRNTGDYDVYVKNNVPVGVREVVEEEPPEIIWDPGFIWFSKNKPETKKCECGKDKHGFAFHSDWCDLFEGENK